MKISIIVPTRDRADLIGATLASALAQTRPADEIIVADDGSTDDTASVVAGFGAQVCHLALPSRGHCAARNAGLASSSGDALMFLDSDDLLLPGALAALEAALEAHPQAAVAYCRSQIVAADGTLREAVWDRVDHIGYVWPQMVRENFLRSPGCALLRRDRLEEAGAWDEGLKNNVDWDVWLRLAEHWEFTRVEEALFQYRLHGGNLSGNNLRMAAGALRVLDKHAARARGDAGHLQILDASRQVYCDFGLAEALDELFAGRLTAVAREVVAHCLSRRPLWTLGRLGRLLALRARRLSRPWNWVALSVLIGLIVWGLVRRSGTNSDD